MMHDIISDMLASDTVPRADRRRVIYAALDEFRDPASNAVSMDDWLAMGEHMGGVDAMGGPVTGLLPAARSTPPAPHRHD